nr:MAG TPA: hypothetical protein [Caudoviricetes sp.]
MYIWPGEHSRGLWASGGSNPLSGREWMCQRGVRAVHSSGDGAWTRYGVK